MRLLRVRLAGIRNHILTDSGSLAGTVILAGPNGSGKTSVLEAISLLCTSRSFVTRADRTLVREGQEGFHVQGEFEDSAGIRHESRVVWTPAGKTIAVDGSPIGSATELIGRFPVVTLSPVHRAIIAGGPAERRAFLDFLISQLHRGYLADLVDYRTALRGRNALLEQCRLRGGTPGAVLDSWNAMLAPIAVRILRTRQRFLEEFRAYVTDIHASIAPAEERPDLILMSTVSLDAESPNAADRYREALDEHLGGDLQRGSTRHGPHRDDLVITLNGRDVRSRASQGQQKSLVIALKLAEYRYLSDRLDENPILLFDDIFSEIDEPRLRGVLAATARMGQTFITTVHDDLHALLDAGIHDVQVFDLREGTMAVREGLDS